MNEPNELETEGVWKLLLKFSIPSIIGMVVNALYSIVDRIFVGRGVNSTALSGVAITYPISNVILAFGMLAGIGCSALVSIKLGQKKVKQAEKIIGNTFTLLIIFSLVVTFFGLIFLEPMLKLLGASKNTMPYAKQFAVIILSGVILQNMGFGLNSTMRAEGDPKMAMKTMLIGAVLNFIMNPLFIFVLKLGVRGSALATIVSQAVCSVWVLYYFIKGKSFLKIKRENIRLRREVVREVISIGMSPFAMQLAASLITITFNKSLEKYGGDTSIAAFSLISSVQMLILMPIFGINQGSQPIIGYNYGAKNIKRVKKALWYAVLSALCISFLGFIIVQIFPTQIISLFNKNDMKLIGVGTRGISIFLLMLPVIGPQAVCTNYFQAVGKAKKSMLLSLLRQVIFLLPSLIVLPRFFGLNGIWAAGPTSDFLAFAVTTIIIMIEMKKIGEINS
ncbi:multidrug transporter MatE [Clostridium acetobutylicum]|nr:multidrug transporter MatE [Clostridium acetobutylicum]